MLSPSFKTKQEAEQAGYIFIKCKVVGYRRNAKGNKCKVQIIDISRGSTFGYKFGLAAFEPSEYGYWNYIGIFGQTKEIFISEATNNGGSKSAYYNAMLKTDYEAALTKAWQALDCEIAHA